jgi:hypothetical protein
VFVGILVIHFSGRKLCGCGIFWLLACCRFKCGTTFSAEQIIGLVGIATIGTDIFIDFGRRLGQGLAAAAAKDIIGLNGPATVRAGQCWAIPREARFTKVKRFEQRDFGVNLTQKLFVSVQAAGFELSDECRDLGTQRDVNFWLS